MSRTQTKCVDFLKSEHKTSSLVHVTFLEVEWPLLPDFKSQADRKRQIPMFMVCQMLPSYQPEQAKFRLGQWGEDT